MKFIQRPNRLGALFLAGYLAAFAVVGTGQTAVPTMTIEIHNNSDRYNIYPVLSTGAHIVDTWMQAAFHIPQSDVATHPYPNPNTFRLYFNPTGTGIPPNSSVTVTLPLYTQLAPGKVDPTMPSQYVDWWNGGRISIYASPASDGAPPKALVADYTTRANQKLVQPVAGVAVPRCAGCQQPLQIFEDSDGELPSNDPAQLTEYTLGAIDLTADPYTLDVKNVDYDVSYVDNAYLPAAMEPFNNPVVGWIGTIQAIDPFKDALRAFLATPAYAGWPQFVDNGGEATLKIPSALHVLQDQTNLVPDQPWLPIEKMKARWTDCTAGGADSFCSSIRDVEKLFKASYANYIANYKSAFSGTCDQSKPADPAILDLDSMLAHVYAWTPFNANCTANTNLLEDTPGYSENNHAGYQTVKAEFDNLNYLPTGDFNPYVKLIHDPQYLNAKYVYAYSVDDGVGNMQTSGEGLIIAIGGPAGLPNPNPATRPIHIPFGDSTKNTVRFVKYGICTETPDRDVNPNFTSFDLSANQISSCTLSFVDNQEPAGFYFFKIKNQPPFPSRPPDGQPIPDTNKTMIDCGGNTPFIDQTWCSNIFGYTQPSVSPHANADDYISVPAPAQPPPQETPTGSINVGKVDVSATKPLGLGGNVSLSVTLTARRAQVSNIEVAFYDGDPQNNGELFAEERIASLAVESPRMVQAAFQTNTCGVHQLFVVVNKGMPTEERRRAQPVRVDCHSQ
jgi:hypothetical protein